MKISIGCDHSALDLKNDLISQLKKNGHEVIDRGTYSYDSCDYTDYGYPAAQAVPVSKPYPVPVRDPSAILSPG